MYNAPRSMTEKETPQARINVLDPRVAQQVAAGEVVEVLAENAGGVEYDQPLFYLRPDEQ